MNVTERSEKVTEILNSLTKKDAKADASRLEKEVEILFGSHIWGHREIVATILVATFLDPTFKASQDFYSCNPRAIYEGPIRRFLAKKGVPTKKSGPLNVAKNISKIDADWATNKRGPGLALSVVKIVNTIEKMTSGKLQKFASYYFKRYLQEAKKVKKLNYSPKENSDHLHITSLCIDLINDVPDGGATPQFIVGSLVEMINIKHRGRTKVSGHLDSVSTTNTTSKKAGDVIEDLGKNFVIYEITVKKFNLQRIVDSYESLRADKNMAQVNEVVVICRKEDVYEDAARNNSNSIMGSFAYEDVLYLFLDIYEFIHINSALLSPELRLKMVNKITDYVNENNRSEKVKKYFRNWFSKA